MRKIVFDVDGTLCRTTNGDYTNSEPIMEVVNKLKYCYNNGYYIILYTARNMRKYNGNIGLINANTLPKLVNWLQYWEIPYHEIHIGKPWCGNDGYYVDDRAIRPNEFLSKTEREIQQFLSGDTYKLKELLNNIANYLPDKQLSLTSLFSNWSLTDIEILEEEMREKCSNFSSLKNCSIKDLYKYLWLKHL